MPDGPAADNPLDRKCVAEGRISRQSPETGTMENTEEAMTALAIWVKFTLRPDKMERFLEAARADAAASVANEPGCRRFDILVPKDEADTVYFYEIYDDEAALEAHRRQPHYAAFTAAVEETGATRDVTLLTLQNPS